MELTKFVGCSKLTTFVGLLETNYICRLLETYYTFRLQETTSNPRRKQLLLQIPKTNYIGTNTSVDF